MKRLRLAIIGFGKVGHACAGAIRESGDLELAGIVLRSESLPNPAAQVLGSERAATHISELAAVDAALVCVPSESVLAVAQEVLQCGVPIVECARLDGQALAAHHNAIHRAALRHRVTAVVGAGLDTGVLSQLRRLFELLIPGGHTEVSNRLGLSLHHTGAAEQIKGVKGALCSEARNADGQVQRYVYVEIEKGADLEKITATICGDPLFAGEETLVFPVDSIVALERPGHGLWIERRGISGQSAHQSLLLEARFDTAIFAAQVMLDAARMIPRCKPGAHSYAELAGR
jgi:diaminopimelate dehydrogenase